MAWVDGNEDENENGKQSHAVAMLASYLASHGVAV